MRRDRRAPARSRSSTVLENSNRDGGGCNRRAVQRAVRRERPLLVGAVVGCHGAMIAQFGLLAVVAADRMGAGGAPDCQTQTRLAIARPTSTEKPRLWNAAPKGAEPNATTQELDKLAIHAGRTNALAGLSGGGGRSEVKEEDRAQPGPGDMSAVLRLSSDPPHKPPN